MCEILKLLEQDSTYTPAQIAAMLEALRGRAAATAVTPLCAHVKSASRACGAIAATASSATATAMHSRLRRPLRASRCRQVLRVRLLRMPSPPFRPRTYVARAGMIPRRLPLPV